MVSEHETSHGSKDVVKSVVARQEVREIAKAIFIASCSKLNVDDRDSINIEIDKCYKLAQMFFDSNPKGS